MIKNRKLRKYLIIFLLIPFIELQTYTMLVEYGFKPAFFNMILSIYSALRLLITLCIAIVIIRRRTIKPSYTVIAVFALITFENIASAINGSLYLNYTIGSLTYIGLALLSQFEIQNHKADFIWACKYLFGLLSIAGALQIILMPHGYFNHGNKAYAIYLLGSKNSSFFYYIVFLFFLFFDDLYKYKIIRLRSIAFIVLFAYAAVQCESMNTLMMMLLTLVLTVIINYGKVLKHFVRPSVIVTTAVLIAIVIVNPGTRIVLTPILNLIGRDTSFTGRDVLWIQAIDVFKKHPLFGNGIQTEYLLATGVWQKTAHSHFLDLLSKYGIFVLLSFIAMPVFAMGRMIHNKENNKQLLALKCSVCFIVLFHSIIDHMLTYEYIILMTSVELLSFNPNIQVLTIPSLNRIITRRKVIYE